jgi:lysozyme
MAAEPGGLDVRLSERGAAFILAHEAIVLEAYRDSVGVWTIGVGHTAAAGPPIPRKGMKVSFAEAMRLFIDDLEVYEDAANRRLRGETIPQNIFDAMVSFHYNTGGIWKASWVAHAIRAGRAQRMARDAEAKMHMDAARKAIMQWRKPAAVIPRRRDERELMTFGDYGALKVLVIPRVTNSFRPNWKSAYRRDALRLVHEEFERRAAEDGQVASLPKPKPKPEPKRKPKTPSAESATPEREDAAPSLSPLWATIGAAFAALAAAGAAMWDSVWNTITGWFQ